MNLPVGEIVEQRPMPVPAQTTPTEVVSSPAQSSPVAEPATSTSQPPAEPEPSESHSAPPQAAPTAEQTALVAETAPEAPPVALPVAQPVAQIDNNETVETNLAPAVAPLPRRKSRADVAAMEIERHDADELVALGATDVAASSPRRRQSNRNKKHPSLVKTL